jgi:hypothetical protein
MRLHVTAVLAVGLGFSSIAAAPMHDQETHRKMAEQAAPAA